jgi:shikimate kinase
MESHARHIVLIGPMGAGKTTIGRALAERLGCPFEDSDEAIIRTLGRTGAEIADEDGVEALHAIELETFVALLRDPVPMVIAAAESVVDKEQGRDSLRSSVAVWLDAEPGELARRRSASDHRRAMTPTEAAKLRASRKQHLADVTVGRVETHHPVAACVDLIVPLVEGAR